MRPSGASTAWAAHLRNRPCPSGADPCACLSIDFFRGPTAALNPTYTFRFKRDRLLLIGFDSTGVNYSLVSYGVTINHLTGKASRTIGESCAGRDEVLDKCRWRTEPAPFERGPLLSIDEVGDGLDFNPWRAGER